MISNHYDGFPFKFYTGPKGKLPLPHEVFHRSYPVETAKTSVEMHFVLVEIASASGGNVNICTGNGDIQWWK